MTDSFSAISVVFAFTSYSRGIDDHIVLTIGGQIRIDRITRRTGDRRYDNALFAKQFIQDERLTDIRPPYDSESDLEAFRLRHSHLQKQGDQKPGQQIRRRRSRVRQRSATFQNQIGNNLPALFSTVRELHLVGSNDYRLSGISEQNSELFIKWSDACMRVKNPYNGN